MHVLWARGEAMIADVHRTLFRERQLAYTTVATVLKRLQERGLIDSRKQGRELIFQPTVSEEDVKRSMVSDLVAKLFRGDPKALVTHLVNTAEVDAGDLEKLQRLLSQEDPDND
jgi:predicted transcriptional regulator